MKRQSERIPTIRKQYVQTIYDGLKTQFDETIKQQLSDQVDIVSTLTQVYQDSINAQTSIIGFLAQLNKNNKLGITGRVQGNQKLQQAKLQLSQLEMLEQSELSSAETQNKVNKQRRTMLISNLSQKIEQAYNIIEVVNKALQQSKVENQALEQKWEKQHQERVKNYEQIKIKEQQYNQIVKKMAQMEQLFQRQKSILQQTINTYWLQIQSNNEQNELLKENIIQYQSQIPILEHQIATNNSAILNLNQQLQYLNSQNIHLKLSKSENDKLIAILEQQLELVLKFSQVQEKKGKKIKKKISHRQSLMNMSSSWNSQRNRDSINKPREFNTEIQQFRGLINNTKPTLSYQQQRKDNNNIDSNRLQRSLSICDVHGHEICMLDKITEKAEQYKNSENSISSEKQQNNHIDNPNQNKLSRHCKKSSKTETNIGGTTARKQNMSDNFIGVQFVSETLCKESSQIGGSYSQLKVNTGFDQIIVANNQSSQQSNSGSGSGQMLKNNNKVLLEIRHCESQNADQNEYQNYDNSNEHNSQQSNSQEDSEIDEQINEIKGLWHRLSVISREEIDSNLLTDMSQSICSQNKSVVINSDNVEQQKQSFVTPNLPQVKQTVSNQLKRSTTRTSKILQKLQFSHLASAQYQNTLQTQLQSLRTLFQTQQINYSNELCECKQKIDELMDRIENMEQQRVRSQRKYLKVQQNYEKTVQGLTKDIQISVQKIDLLCGEIQRIRDQNQEFGAICEQSKKELQSEKRKIENLDYQIKQLTAEKQKLTSDKAKLEQSLKTQILQNKSLHSVVSAKQQQVQQKQSQLQKTINELSSCKQELSLVQLQLQKQEQQLTNYQKQSKKQQLKCQQHCDEITKLRAKVLELELKVQQMDTQLKEKSQLTTKLTVDIKVLQERVKDMSYVNELLKKDVNKIKQIQQTDWDKQCDDNGSSLQGSRTIKITNVPHRQQIQPVIRLKNSSFTTATTLNKENCSSKPNLSKNATFTSGNKFLQSLKQNMFSSITSSRVDLNKGQNEPAYHIGPSQNQIGFKLDLDAMNKNKGKLIVKNYGKENRDYQGAYKSQALTDRPLTQIIKKKYNMQ